MENKENWPSGSSSNSSSGSGSKARAVFAGGRGGIGASAGVDNRRSDKIKRGTMVGARCVVETGETALMGGKSSGQVSSVLLGW